MKKFNHMKRRVAALPIAACLLLLGAAPPASAWSPGDAKVHHATTSDPAYLAICKDWSGTPADPGCRNGTSYAGLARGSTSTFWADTDGVRVPANCTGKFYVGAIYNSSYYGGSKGKWIKVGGLGGGAWRVVIDC